MYEKDILKNTEGKAYFCELELSKKMKVNFAYIKDAIDGLIADGTIKEVGKHYSIQFGKLFRYCTQETIQVNIEKTQTKIINRQYSAQKLQFIRKLISDLQDHHGVNSTIVAGLQHLKTTDVKLDLQYHALEKKDAITCYELVIKYGGMADAQYLENKPKKSKELKQAA